MSSCHKLTVTTKLPWCQFRVCCPILILELDSPQHVLLYISCPYYLSQVNKLLFSPTCLHPMILLLRSPYIAHSVLCGRRICSKYQVYHLVYGTIIHGPSCRSTPCCYPHRQNHPTSHPRSESGCPFLRKTRDILRLYELEMASLASEHRG